MTEAEVNSNIKNLLGGVKVSDLGHKKSEIQQKISDPSTPPELKAALQQVNSALFDQENPQPLSDSQKETVSTLQRHRDEFPIKKDNIQEKIDSKDTPPDLKAALTKLQDDPALSLTIDIAAKGGKADGKISAKDLNAISDRGEMKEYTSAKTQAYAENYIPSDADPLPAGGRKMTANDAMREFYLYSDSLPKHIGTDELKKIADGSAHGKKMPPQLMAAAQHMLDNSAAFKKLTENGENVASKDGRVTRSAFLDNINRDVHLTPEQNKTLKTLDKNRDVFLGSNMTRDSLKKLVENSETSGEIKKTAQSLLADPQLYGMLDNAKTGHRSSSTKTADDGQISKNDLDAFLGMSTTYGKPAPKLPPVSQPKTEAGIAAMKDMKAGVIDDPDEKKKKGGELTDIVAKIFSPLLKVAAGIMHGISIAASFLGSIPFLKPLLAPVVMATEGMAGGLDIARAKVEGGDVSQAATMAAIGLAGAAVGAATIGGAGAAVAAGLKAGVGKGVASGIAKATGEGVEAGATQGAKAGVTKGASEAVENTATKAASKSVSEGADTGVNQTGKSITKAEAKDQAKQEAAQEVKQERKEELKDSAQDALLDQANGNNSTGSSQPSSLQMAYPMSAERDLYVANRYQNTKETDIANERRQQRLAREANNKTELEANERKSIEASDENVSA